MATPEIKSSAISITVFACSVLVPEELRHFCDLAPSAPTNGGSLWSTSVFRFLSDSKKHLRQLIFYMYNISHLPRKRQHKSSPCTVTSWNSNTNRICQDIIFTTVKIITTKFAKKHCYKRISVLRLSLRKK